VVLRTRQLFGTVVYAPGTALVAAVNA